MNKQEKLKRDIATLTESIKSDWQDIATLQLSTTEILNIKQHIQWCNDELKNLYEKL